MTSISTNQTDCHAGAQPVFAPTGTLAPPWHTAVIILLMLGISLINALAQRRLSIAHSSHLLGYAVTLVWEWILVALVHWGLLMRGTPLRQLLGVRRTGAAEWWTDIAIGLGFWFGSSIVLAGIALLLRFARLDPENIRRAVLRLAPSSPTELAAWIALSITAGICEELIFRGYLQQQFSALTRRAWLGVAISALIFGLAHGYEGVAGMLLIALYGALFSVLALLRRSLRAGMFAHAWHDAISGLALYLGDHLLHRIPH